MTEMILATLQPLPGEEMNSASEVARSLAEEGFQADRLTIQMLPADMRRAAAILVDRIRGIEPQVVFILGQTMAAAEMLIELHAKNLRAFEGIRDRGGNCPAGEPIVSGAPPVLATSIRNEELIAFLVKRGIKARASRDAGAHLTNHLLFEILHHIGSASTHLAEVSVGALSLPLLPQQARRRRARHGGMSAAAQLRAVRSAIEFALG